MGLDAAGLEYGCDRLSMDQDVPECQGMV
jgi:hypothetical protein